MNCLRKSFWSNFCYSRPFLSGYYSSDVRLNRTQYLSTLNNVHKPQLLACKCKGFQQKFSVFEAVRSVQPSLVTFSKQFLKTWFAYVPLFGGLRYEDEGCLWFKTFDEIDVGEFIRLFNMPDTFYSRFRVIELHVWMLLFNFPENCRIHFHVRNGLIKTMWNDAEARAKLIDKKNPYLKTDFRIMYNKFKVSLIIYDNGFSKSDTALCSALWYNFFDGRDVDPRLLEGFVEYVRYQGQVLSDITGHLKLIWKGILLDINTNLTQTTRSLRLLVKMHKLSKLNYDVLRTDPDKEGIWSSPRPFLRHLKN